MVKFTELMAICAVYSTALDITDAPNAFASEGNIVDHDDLATITPYITHAIRRLGDLVLDLDPPDTVPVTRLDLEPRALFPGGPTA
ncbi:hypothetical protein [Amycolatopsis thermophila]|uniref:Tn3 transposase DDE domain-containing protein n=1 Tax=Amycolatopsis thermophila TaxID=206084 RepID=A0ABU0F1N2_9PSEU|nr:hypothetical protein [Amycolatopsis thermophila]MDQ0381480.1 hypothetical protein [Amycolatopsis thermophila]